VLWGLPRLGTMSGRDRSRPWGAAEADVMTCRSSHFGTDGLSQGSADCRRVQNNSQHSRFRDQGEDHGLVVEPIVMRWVSGSWISAGMTEETPGRPNCLERRGVSQHH